MKTVNLQIYADPDVLREFSPRMLVALMDEHRPFLASKGVELPPVESLKTATGDGEFDYEAVAPIFRAVEDIPKDLVERFHMVRQMSGPRQMDRILDTVRERQLEFPLPMKQYSPQDMAAHLLLTDPKLFRELHAELAVTRYRTFTYFVPRRKKAHFKPPASMDGLEKTLNSWYEAHQRMRSARVFWRRHGDEFWFHVRHAEPVRREGAVDFKDCASDSAIYCPERHGLVIYNAKAGELRMHADSDPETELFRLAFGLHLFKDGNYFPASAKKFTLEPLKDGRKALAWGGIAGVRSITLQAIEYQKGGELAARDKTSAPDVLTVFEARGFQIPDEAEIRLARFQVHFDGEKKPRNFTIRPSNDATFAMDHDGTVLEPWLVRQKFALPRREEGGANGAWKLEN